MPKIFLDANIFIDFYQATTDRIDLFDQLIQRSNHLVLTSQTIDEVHRNRSSTLAWLRSQFEKSLKVSPYTTSVLREMRSFQELVTVRDSLVAKGKEVLTELDSLISDEANDPVAVKFNQLIGSAGILVLEMTPDHLRAAQERKVLGRAPTSPDKHTIGDEVTWEILVSDCQNDLVIVTRDRTYLDNSALLIREYRRRSGKSLMITDRLSEALKAVGEEPPGVILDEEDVFLTGVCPECHVDLDEFGYEGSDGDGFGWLECPKCGKAYYP